MKSILLPSHHWWTLAYIQVEIMHVHSWMKSKTHSKTISTKETYHISLKIFSRELLISADVLTWEIINREMFKAWEV